MNVLMVVSECAPFIKTGGLADVAGALPSALATHDISCRTLMPAYPALKPLLAKGKEVAVLKDLPGGNARVVAVKAKGIDLLLLDQPDLYDREGGPYTSAQGKDWDDNHIRFAALAMAGTRISADGINGWRPEIAHAHDWQAALLPVYLKQLNITDVKSVLTIHNIAFQGRFGPHVLGALGLRQDWFHPEALEYYGDLGFLKAGLTMADQITTVSPTYAREILTPAFGAGLEGVLSARSHRLTGILNGIDLDVWNPATDDALQATYDARSLKRKAKTRAAIARRLGLSAKCDGPLFCVVSRLTEQKGLDILLEAVPHLVAKGGQLAVLGSGDPVLEQGFERAAKQFAGQVGTFIGYDEAFSHELQGGSDAILIPSRFEPCGLTQLYGLRYGTLPVVSQTGGLADTVVDANVAALNAGVATGFKVYDLTADGLRGTLDRVFDVYQSPKRWQSMQRAAMKNAFDWDASAQDYADVYKALHA
ncbi:MAG: glycogen synthase GlgA [Cognatishimia sp.]|uniref:glycogen synthase GlgA n=1 Tax=Cognatishimia sp. TaxID=2211648 RepID=UPI003B8EA26B